jgi:hypothetical protein
MPHSFAPTACQPEFPETTWEDSSENGCYANALSEQLLEHMLDCDACLNTSRDCEYEMMSCPVHRDLQEQIVAFGGPTKPLVLAF